MSGSCAQPRVSASPHTNHLHRGPLSSHLSALASPSLSPLGAGQGLRGSATHSQLATPTGTGMQNLAPSSSSSSVGDGALTPAPIKLSLSSHR